MKKITMTSCILLSILLSSFACTGPSIVQCGSGGYGIIMTWCCHPCEVCLPQFPIICIQTTCCTYTPMSYAVSDSYVSGCTSGFHTGGTDCSSNGTANCVGTGTLSQCDGSDLVFNYLSGTASLTSATGSCYSY